MSSTTRTHGVDISAIERSTDDLDLSMETIAPQGQSTEAVHGQKEALHGIEHGHPKKRVTAFIGPSGCGKSTLLRCFNRMNDLVDGCRIEARFYSTRPTFMPRAQMLRICVDELEWYSRSQTHFRRASAKTSRTGCAYRESIKSVSWMKPLNGHFAPPHCGTK